MFLELIATVFAGIAMAGVVMLLNRVTGGHLPRWLTPVAAGLAMIAATVSNEYSWYSRTTANLPEGVEVAQSIEKTSFYQPWTYAKPYVDRFVAVDAHSLKTNEQFPDQRLLDLFFFGRWSPVKKMPVLFDCAANKRANMIDGLEFDDSGQVINAEWVSASADDPVQSMACEVS